MQTVLKQGSIDKPLTFDVGLIQLSFIPVCSLNTYATFQSNCAEGLHFSAFHYCKGNNITNYLEEVNSPQGKRFFKV